MAVVTLTPYKTLGEDGIYPVLLQEGIMLLIGPLYNMFRYPLVLGHVSGAWKIARAVIKQKTGRLSHVGAKDCNRISLTSLVHRLVI